MNGRGPRALPLLVAVLAIATAAFGLGFMVAPGLIWSLYGVQLDSEGTFVTRMFGTTNVGAGLLLWWARSALAENADARGLLAALSLWSIARGTITSSALASRSDQWCRLGVCRIRPGAARHLWPHRAACRRAFTCAFLSSKCRLIHRRLSQCLRATPVADLVAHGAANAFNQSTVDGLVLLETHLAALTAGHLNRVPVMQGAQRSRGAVLCFASTYPVRLPIDYLWYRRCHVASPPTRSSPGIRSSPTPRVLFEAASAAYGDAAFACTAAASSQLLVHSVPTYFYDFDDTAASPLGAMHTAELKYFVHPESGWSSRGSRQSACHQSGARRANARLLDTFCSFGEPQLARRA